MAAPRQRIWDIPTRLFHWLLVALFAFSWWSAENREMEWHVLSGVAVLGLLLFRILWGFLGGSTARFANFVRSPLGIVRYMRGNRDARGYVGHNPLGGYSVLAMLVVIIVQVGTGLFATDVDGLDSGPLSYLVEFETGRALSQVHELAFNVMLVLAGLHIVAVLFYLIVRKNNLLGPMITGSRRAVNDAEGELVPAKPIWLIACLIVAGAIAWWVSNGAGG